MLTETETLREPLCNIDVEALATALEEALGDDAQVATKADLKALESALTIRIGTMIGAATAVLIAIKFFTH